MMFMHVLACVAMLPALAVAERFQFGGCGSNFDNFVTPIAHTAQGLETTKGFAAGGTSKMYLWHPSNKEKDQKITSMELLMTPVLGGFTFSYKKGGSVTPTVVAGTMKYQFQPKQVIMLTSIPETNAHEGFFSFDNKGAADLYPVLITKTDLILRGCLDAFMGRVETLYVLTTQNYSSLDETCSKQAIRDNFDNWDVVLAP